MKRFPSWLSPFSGLSGYRTFREKASGLRSGPLPHANKAPQRPEGAKWRILRPRTLRKQFQSLWSGGLPSRTPQQLPHNRRRASQHAPK